MQLQNLVTVYKAQVDAKENASTHPPCTVTFPASMVAERRILDFQMFGFLDQGSDARETMQNFVKTLTGKTIVVHVGASDTVGILFTKKPSQSRSSCFTDAFDRCW